MQITSNKFGRKIRLNKSEKDRIEQIAMFCNELGRYDEEAKDCSRLLCKLHGRYATVKSPETTPLFDTEHSVQENVPVYSTTGEAPFDTEDSESRLDVRA
jgi:hypothetical protein